MASSRRGPAVHESSDPYERAEVLRLLAHDLKNPLTAVRVLAEMLLEDLPSEHHRDLNDLLEAVDRATVTAEGLSDLGRIEGGEEPTSSPDPFDLRELVDEVVDRPAFSTVVHLVPGAPVPVRSDAAAVERALIAVLLNGVRMIAPDACLSVGVADGVISVQHPGVPLADEDRDALFALYGGIRMKARRVRAAALGLGAARATIDAIGGSLTLNAGPDGMIARIDLVGRERDRRTG